MVQSKEGNHHETRRFYEKWTIKGIHHHHRTRHNTLSSSSPWHKHTLRTFVVGDRDLVLATRALVGGRHVQDSVGVDIERHLDLRDSSRRWRDVGQLKLSEEVVVLGHRTLSLIHLDQDARLVVRVRRERLRLFRWDRRVTLDEAGHDAAGGLDTEGQGRDVEQEQVLDGLGLVSV